MDVKEKEQKTQEQINQEDRKRMEEQLKKVAPNLDPSTLDAAQIVELVGQYSRASVLYYGKVKDMSNESKQEYEQFLLKTNPSVDIEERFKLADQLYKSAQLEKEPKQGEKEEEKLDGRDKPSPKAQVDKDAKANIGDSKGGSNLISDINEAPLGSNEEVLNWREKRWKAHMNYVTKV